MNKFLDSLLKLIRELTGEAVVCTRKQALKIALPDGTQTAKEAEQ